MRTAVLLPASIVLTSLACAGVGEPTPPTWPEDADLTVSQTQILYDAPATTEDELREREDAYTVDLSWPKAEGATVYEVSNVEEVLATLPVQGETHPTSWNSRVKGAQLWSVRAGRGESWSEPLVGSSTSLDPIALPNPTILGILSDGPSGGGEESVFAADAFGGGLDAELGTPRARLQFHRPEPNEAIDVRLLQRVLHYVSKNALHCAEALPSGAMFDTQVVVLLTEAGTIGGLEPTGDDDATRKLVTCISTVAKTQRFGKSSEVRPGRVQVKLTASNP